MVIIHQIEKGVAKIVIAVGSIVRPMRTVVVVGTIIVIVVVVVVTNLVIVNLAQVLLHHQSSTTIEIVVQITTTEISRHEPLQAVELDTNMVEEVVNTVATTTATTLPPIAVVNITTTTITKEQVNIARMEIIHQAVEGNPIKDLQLGGLINSIELSQLLM